MKQQSTPADWSLGDQKWHEYYVMRQASGFAKISEHQNPKANLLDLIRCQAPKVWNYITGSWQNQR